MEKQYARISIHLSKDEFIALSKSAQEDLRPPRDHARYLLRRVLLGEHSVPDVAEKSATTTQLPTGTTPEHI